MKQIIESYAEAQPDEWKWLILILRVALNKQLQEGRSGIQAKTPSR